ncbi:uncharacterized protein LOC112467431 [Temnothorax curvispinosus]|uniref:Chloride channel CLIC-like protein 1 n=1 Tax=Temnothorax curvispinosus TaxID=300111 RepID=A0A6J1RGF8_9HYME|nr:uncharacterized protein LOC112467431 [Temnothorax curvispinosus]
MAQPSSSCRELDERNTREAIFYKRLIAILLSNLAIQRTDDDGSIGRLNIEASSSQFEYLRNFVNGQGSIREVDRILKNAIKRPAYSACDYMAVFSVFLSGASYYFNLFTSKASEYWTLMNEHWDITIIAFTLVAGLIILRRQRWSRGLLIFLMIDVVFVISFFITWWRLIQEAEIKLMAAQAQFAEMPIACQPDKMSLWDKMWEKIAATNDCERYYETIKTNPTLQVTPAFALTHFVTTTFVQPLSYFGSVMSEFVDNATSKLNFVYKFPVVIALFSSFCVCVILIPFFWIGGSINFGFGPFFKFGIKGRRRNSNEKKERIERIYEEISPRMRLKDSDKTKRITSGRDNDPAAGGDTGDTTDVQLRERCKGKKCKCENKSGDGDVE